MRLVAQQILSVFIVTSAGLANTAHAAELRANDLFLLPGETASVIISGRVQNELTPGVTVLVSIVPGPNAVGTVTFTPAPPVDISQLDDPWPDVGTFDAFDTDLTSSTSLNGCNDDNGTFVPEELIYDGDLVSLPIIASPDADGVWVVQLTIPGDVSRWESVPTTLRSGIVRVGSLDDIPATSTWTLIALTLSILAAGTILARRTPQQTRPIL